MELNSKQRASLRSQAGKLQAIMQIGKDGITDNLIDSVNSALAARELIKLTVLENSYLEPSEVLGELAGILHAQPVAAIGRKIVLYRRAEDPKKRKIVLP